MGGSGKKIVAIAQDHTGCHGHDHYEALRDAHRFQKYKQQPGVPSHDTDFASFEGFTEGEERALLHNAPTLTYYHEMLAKLTPDVDTLVFLSLANGQDFSHEQAIRQHERLPGTSRGISSFTALKYEYQWFVDNKPAHVENLILDGFLLADVYDELQPPGTAFEKALLEEQGQLQNAHPRVPLSDVNRYKLPTVYAHIHRLASQYPEHDIDYWLVEDRMATVEQLSTFFSANPDFVPENVTIHFKLNCVVNAENPIYLDADNSAKVYLAASGYIRYSIDASLHRNSFQPYTDFMQGEPRTIYQRPYPSIQGDGGTNQSYQLCVRDMLIEFKMLVSVDQIVLPDAHQFRQFVNNYAMRSHMTGNYIPSLNHALMNMIATDCYAGSGKDIEPSSDNSQLSLLNTMFFSLWNSVLNILNNDGKSTLSHAHPSVFERTNDDSSSSRAINNTMNLK